MNNKDGALPSGRAFAASPSSPAVSTASASIPSASFEVRQAPDEPWVWQVWDIEHPAKCNHFPVLTVDSKGAANDFHAEMAHICAAALNQHFMTGAASTPSVYAAALELIFLTNWGWRGGGSDVRVSNGAGSTCREVLGLQPLPAGWPSEVEYDRRASLARIVAQAIEARSGETGTGSIRQDAPNTDAKQPGDEK